MSIAVALDSSYETINKLETTINILKDLLTKDYTLESSKVSLDDLVDWYEDMHKILTDYSMFVSDVQLYGE